MEGSRRVANGQISKLTYLCTAPFARCTSAMAILGLLAITLWEGVVVPHQLQHQLLHPSTVLVSSSMILRSWLTFRGHA